MRGISTSIRLILVGTIILAAGVAVVLVGRTGGTSYRLASANDFSLLDNPFVVPGLSWFADGQQQAAERVRRASPEAVTARESSSTAYAHLGRGGVARVLSHTFPGVVGQAGAARTLPAGARIVRYLTANSAQVMLPGHRPGIAEYSSPVAKRGAAGRYSPVDLSLSPSGGGFVPVRSPVALEIPGELSAGVRMAGDGVSLTPVDDRGRPLSASGSAEGDTVVYANSQQASDTIVKPTATGFQLDGLLRSVESPLRLLFKVGGPAGTTLEQDAGSGVVRVMAAGSALATIMPPGAHDAAGTSVPASMRVSGDTLVLDVPHRSASYLYPIEVDPEINDNRLAGLTASKPGNWEFKSTNEARFGHKEGVGKESLETTGTAAYEAGKDFAYWAYETQGNSKIYVLKTKTSAKNVGAKIESFLMFTSAAGNENKVLLSTEIEGTAEYSEKPANICAWNASKVEECLPGAGKEKNTVRFQQSAAGTPTNFKFSDTMTEGIVEISEPAGEHSTTSFNTTSPEVEGEVVIEGKKVVQKRVNALYGNGIWITESKGALQLIAKDPGIGVASTRLEYEKSSGAWENVSEHKYLENENACQGVQCYPEHAEYWTLDPKLPDGEDNIRYRAEEAIAGTVSPESEAASKKTIKIDTKAPRSIRLSGLPFGNELSERPYVLTAEATDGEGSTVASSGVKSLALFVSGREVAETGKQAGCSVAKGQCTATAEWTINGAELGAGHHAIVVVATDKAGNEARIERTVSIRHSTPVALGPGSVDLQSGDFTLSSTDVAMGSGLTVTRNYSSRAPSGGVEGPLGPQWRMNLGTTESLFEMVDNSVLLTDANGEQAIFAAIGGGEYESPAGDSNLTLKLEENKETKQKLAYYLEDSAKHTKTKFTQPGSGSKTWVPARQEGTVATDAVTYSYRTVEAPNEYPLPANPERTEPREIAKGSDGNIWFVGPRAGRIEKVTPAGLVTEYAVPSGLGLSGIAAGPDGNIWYANSMAKVIGKMNTSGETIEYKPTGAVSKITAGPDGNIWFTGGATVGKISAWGVVTEYILPSESMSENIVAGPDGNMWFTNDYCFAHSSSRCAIGKITMAGVVTEYNLTSGAPSGIAVGADGNLWFTSKDISSSKIGKITPAGSITEYAIPSASNPKWITAGPDGNMWFTDLGTDKVGKITTAGAVSEFALPSGSSPEGIAAGADGNIWFAEETANKIGMLSTSGTITEPTEVLAPVPAGVSCSPMKEGCRALKFTYATSTTARGEENPVQWGEYKGRLLKVFLEAYDPVSKAMTETSVASYAYDNLGRLRDEWDPRSLSTIYGYDAEGHVTALTPPGQESWAFAYGNTANDAGTGRLLAATRAPASEALWDGENWNGKRVANTEAPAVSGTAAVGVRLAASTGKWTEGPIAYSYKWEDCTLFFIESCTPIAGANGANYTPTASDLKLRLRVVVTATNGQGSVSTASASTLPVQNKTEFTPGGVPRGITRDSGSLLWFADSEGKIDSMTTSGVVQKHLTFGSPRGVTMGPDGNVWFTDAGGFGVANGIGKFVVAKGEVFRYELPTGSSPAEIVKGSDNNLWFTEQGTSKIGKITTAGAITQYALPANSQPSGIAVGIDGNIWFTEQGTSKIGKITTAGAITEYALPANSQPRGITGASEFNLWFTEYNTDKIGKITTAGAITEYALPSGSGPESISVSKSHISFTDHNASKIGSITSTGAVSEYTLPAERYPTSITEGPDGNLWYVESGNNTVATGPSTIVEGAVQTSGPSLTMEYGAPLSGSGAPNMTSAEVAKWGQVDEPVEATAIMPPDAAQGWPATDYKRATIHYLDEHGREVNVSQPSTAPYGSVSTTEYNEANDVTRTLSPGNRQAALEAGSKSAEVAKSLATYYSYRAECSKESENKHEAEGIEGTRLCDVEGPQHEVKYMVGKEQRESLGRLHTKYFYDEEAPAGETYNLQTKKVSLTELSNEAKEEVDGRITKTSYSGQSNLGWKLRAPTSVTVDPEGKKLTTTTLYNSVTGQITETRAPAGGAGGSAHDTKLIYYTTEANAEYPACGGHPEWATLLCKTLPAKQPGTSGVPNLPVVTMTSYNVYDEPLVVTETFGSTVRTKTKTYDYAGRLKTSETTSTANTALPKLTDEYNSSTGALEKLSTTVGENTQTATSKRNTLGQLTEYIDADGNITKYRYAGPENDWLLEEMADGSDGGTGKQTYAYNSVTKQLEELTDSAAGVFKASYDAEGRMVSEAYPNAMCADSTYNSVGEATKIEYLKTGVCSEHSAPVWFSETRAPSVRGETFARSSTLANETYAYDSVGELTEAQETPSGEGCTVRLYAYDTEANRLSQTTRTPGGEGKCASEGGTTVNHTYDSGNRLTDTGVAYDSFGNMTKVPAADAEGHELSSTFYVDGAVASQTQNAVTNNYHLDPEGRIRETVSGATTTITHYDSAGGAVAWTSEGTEKTTRNIPGIDGALAAVQTNGGTPVLQLHDLQGNITATAALSSSETKLLSTYNNTEFGVPNKEKAPPKYSWLGAGGVASAFSSGVITYGATSYVPQIGRALQSETVEAPGIAPGGTGAGAAYVHHEEPWVFQGAAAEAAEAPGLEAARERAAAEAAEQDAGAYVDPLSIERMNLKKAADKAEEYFELEAVGVETYFHLPEEKTLLELAGKLAGEFVSQLGDALAWLSDAGTKLKKCSQNKRQVNGQQVNICLFEYDENEWTPSVLGVHPFGTLVWPNFSVEPVVNECLYIKGSLACVADVHIETEL